MIVNPLQQNSEEWLEFRKGRSGGSEFKKLWIPGLPLKSKIVEKLEADGQPLPPADKRLAAAELAAMLEPEELAELKLESDRKMGYYEIIADRTSRPITPNDYIDRLNGEPFSMMARGHLLEPEALAAFAEKTGKCIHPQSCVWMKEDGPEYNGAAAIYISPDGVVCSKEQMDKPIESFVPTEAVEVKCLSNAETIKTYLTGRYPQEYEPQVLKCFIVNKELKTLYFVMYTDTTPGLELQIFEIKREDIENRLTEAEAFESAVMKLVDRDAEKIEKLSF